MALLLIDGFDAGDYVLKGWSPASTVTVVASDRFGVGRALECAGTARSVTRGIPFSGKAFVGVAIETGASLTSSLWVTFLADVGAVSHVYVRSNVDGSLSIMRASATVLASTAPGLISPNTWYYLEASATISDTVGTVTVRVNGAEVLTTSGDTKNGGTSTQIDTVRLTGSATFDDFYALDETGPAPHNTFLGDVRVLTTVPTAPGASTQLTPSAGANWECVDDLPYSLADYVTSSTAGHKDTYGMGDVFGVTTVFGVQTNILGRKTDAGARGVIPVVRSGGADYPGAAHTLNATDTTHTAVRVTDPATAAAWTMAGVNAMEMGAEVA